MSTSGLVKAQEKMRANGQSEEAIRVFTSYYSMLESGASGELPERSILPFSDPQSPGQSTASPSERAEALARTVVIKLNGGLGTSMGLSAPKTLLPVKDDINFLDVIVQQVLSVRQSTGAKVPLIFMNSFRTEDETLDYLAQYPELAVEDLPLSFLQSQEPRLYADTLDPVEFPGDPEAEWCPPGHGDLYPALASSGVLDRLLDHGFLYAQVSNGDNLGATPDADIAGWFAQSQSPFAMEVCRRTPNDRKGGHLALDRETGRLLLREIAQTPQEDLDSFQDIDKHRYFNTNTIWINLKSLKETLDARDAVLNLPLIRNLKSADPEDSQSPQMVQIESAMGAAIQVFEGATAVEVPRERFLPVKTTNELLILRSDLYELRDDGTLVLQAATPPRVDLEPRYYRTVEQLDARIPEPPSLVAASSLTVEGDWTFIPGAAVHGDLVLGPEGGRFG